MSLTSAIDSFYKTPYAIVRFNGNHMRDIYSIKVSQSMGAISQASIEMPNKPNIQPESRVTIELGYNNQARRVFTGFVDSIEYNEENFTYVVNCRDVLKKAVDTYLVQEVAFGIDVSLGTYYYSTYTAQNGGEFTKHVYSSLSALNSNHPETTGNYSSEGVRAEAVVQWLLAMTGLAEGTEIQVDSTNFWIGDINPAKFHLTNIYDAVNQIADLIGWYVYADPGGVARFQKRPRNPSGFVTWTYKSSNPYNVFNVKSVVTNTDLRNYIEVRGNNGIRSVARSNSDYIGNTPYRGAIISNELIDTQEIADFFATRVLSDLNRLKTTVTLDVDGNPFLFPGDTIRIETKELNALFMVESVEHAMSADGYSCSVAAVQFLGDSNFEERPNAVTADFNAIFVSVLGDPRYVVQFDASSSTSQRGIITSYTWNFPNTPAITTTEASIWHVFTDSQLAGSGAEVTLTVQDSLNATGSVTKNITLESITDTAGEPKARALYAALTSIAAGTLDGGQSWNTLSIPAISCGASNFAPGSQFVTSGYALFGCSDATIHKTVDGCRTSQVVLSNAGSAVNYVNIMETNWNYAIAGTQNGRIYVSNDTGNTWTLKHTFPFAINEVRYGYQDQNYILVVGAGNGNVYHSFNGGASWAPVGGLLSTLDVRRESSGSQTNYFAHATGIVSSSGNIPFSAGSPDIRAISIMIDRDDGIMAVDSTGQHWTFSGGAMQPTQFNPANKTRHMLRDGEMPMVVYYATESGVYKSVDRNSTILPLYLGGTGGRMVWYGPLGVKPPIPGNIFVASFAVPYPTSIVQTLSNTTVNPGIFMAMSGGSWLCVANYAATYGGPEFATMPGYIFTIHTEYDDRHIRRVRIPASGSIVYEPQWQLSKVTESESSYRTTGLRIISASGFYVLLCRVRSYLYLYDRWMFIKNINTNSHSYAHTPAYYRCGFPVLRNKSFRFGTTDGLYLGYADYNPQTDTVVGDLYDTEPFNYYRIPQAVLSDDSIIAYLLPSEDPQGIGRFCRITPNGSIQHLPALFDALLSSDHTDSGTLSSVFESAVHPGRIYFYESQNVCCADSYGLGERQVLFTNPIGGSTSFAYLCVTHDKQLTKDYLTIVVWRTWPEQRISYIYYSLDAGQTWNQSNTFHRNLSDKPTYAFWVDGD